MTHKTIKELFAYNPDTGIVTHTKTDPRRKCRAGEEAGTLRKDGYRHMACYGTNYLTHRVIYSLMTDAWPKSQVDHINHIRDDNRWLNLREATNSVNHKNQRMKETNTSGYVGVYWNDKNQKWISQIVVDGKCIYIGSYVHLLNAVTAREKAEFDYGFHKNHGGIVA